MPSNQWRPAPINRGQWGPGSRFSNVPRAPEPYEPLRNLQHSESQRFSSVLPPVCISNTTTVIPPLLTVTIGGKNAKALVDTGAACSFIVPELRHSGIVKAKEMRLKAVNGTPLHVYGVYEMSLTVGSARITHPVVVSPEILYDLILGMDFLRAFQCSIDVNQDGLIFGGERVSLREHTDGGPDWVLEVHPVDKQGQVSRLLSRANPDISLQQRERMHALVIKHQAAFAWECVPLGRTPIIQHRIDT
ncbi:unnamed protein product [Echinostoma caproni]|uniref:Peptidase A2 domain-containing protein n=1 Tax=Echinostoma caproni TaxID=27848 RepID=A0A183B8L3_9TREM|nr:unnamed protein product [Echinostoma caproni]